MPNPTTFTDANPPRADAAERVLADSAVFPISRAQMFELWTAPEHQRHWFFPRGMTVEVHENDVRVGGRARLTMRDQEGLPIELTTTYRELVPPERIVFEHQWAGDPPTLVTVLFTDEGGNTRVTLHQGVFASREMRESHEQGWRSTLDNLADYASRACS